jgi:hypothetical protein
MKNITFLLKTTIVVLSILYTTNTFSQTTIASYDFSSGIQGWIDGGANASRGTYAPYSCDGSIGHIWVRDDTSTSIITSPVLDLTSYTSVNYSFCVKTFNLEGNDGFLVEYYDGSSWTTVKSYKIGTDFANSGSGYSYDFSLSLDSTTSIFAANSQFRFYGDSNKSNEFCRFDNVLIEGFTSNSGNASNLIDFDGVDDYIDFGNNHNYIDDLTIEAWILQENTTTKGTIVSKNNTKSGNEDGYSLEINNNYVRFIWYKTSGNNVADITSPYPITNNKWYHIAVTVDNNSVQLYIDGVEVEDDNTTSNPTTNTNNFIIGATYDSDTPTVPKNYFNGYIDEVRIWDVSLSPTQIHEMMNQEIEQNESSVRGTVISMDVSDELLWSDLKGYYTMTNSAEDSSSSSINGFPMNTTTEELQNAPMPYTTKADGTWSDNSTTTPWLYGDTIWNTPNNTGIDGSTTVDWNIVQTSHNLTSGNKDITVLALISDTAGKKLIIANPNEEQDENNSGQGLRVTHYLKMDGDIDLVGESQLLQDSGSILDINSSGKLQKDQQGTRDLYTYNFWSSPVGISNTTINNSSYTLPDVFKDGTSSNAPLEINFLTSGYDGSSGNPIGIADYWIWKYANRPDEDYSQWQHVRSTGTLLAGEGFTLKGVSNTNGDVSQVQNYVFEGKPNNGEITLTIDSGNEYLIGNPYPSAIDAHQFLSDNKSQNSGNGVFTGPLYFWNHWGNGSHASSDYQGGYATYSMGGGTPAPSSGSNNGRADKSPTRYIPVGQAFFIRSQTGATIKFNNSQRVFIKENDGDSNFMRTTNSKTSAANSDTRMKIRIGFNSVNSIHRQLLLTEDINTTPDFDWGYDALVYAFQIDDMFWMINSDKYVIQSTNEINSQTVIPLGVITKNDGLNTITIDNLENVPNDLDIYVHDKELDIYYDLREKDYEVDLLSGEYLERFEITFSDPNAITIVIEEEIEDIEEIVKFEKLDIYFSNSTRNVVIHNPDLLSIKSIEMLNVLGQSVYRLNDISSENYSEIKTRNLKVGSYIIKLETEEGTLTKKVLVQ